MPDKKINVIRTVDEEGREQYTISASSLADLADVLGVTKEQSHVQGMHLELTDELSQIIDGDRYPSVPAFVALKEILGQLRPEPEREPLPLRRHYEPPSKGRYRSRR
jgi:hypothetical protein